MDKNIKNLDKCMKDLQMTFGLPDTKIKQIYVNIEQRLTIVKWIDGTSTKVKCSPEDDFCVTIGVALAYCYKCFGSKNKFSKIITERTKEVG